jgi:predicted ArsR family transcriptional regulator
VHSVRKRILEILKQRNGATVAELAEALEMAPVSVRHHLDILQGDSLIRVERVERSGGVGRPQQVYALTEEAGDYFPNNFAALASNLVRQIKHILSDEQVECVFRNMAHDLAEQFERNEPNDLCLEQRLDHIADFLNERGYLASWESDEGDPAGSYLLHKHNCPYAGVSDEYHELCLMDETLVNLLVDRPCQRVSHMATNDHCCTYRIGEAVQSGATTAIRLHEVEPYSKVQDVGVKSPRNVVLLVA